MEVDFASQLTSGYESGFVNRDQFHYRYGPQAPRSMP